MELSHLRDSASTRLAIEPPGNYRRVDRETPVSRFKRLARDRPVVTGVRRCFCQVLVNAKFGKFIESFIQLSTFVREHPGSSYAYASTL